MRPQTHVFDILRELASLPEEALTDRLDQDTVAVLVTCSELLSLTPIKAEAIGSGTVAKHVHQLNTQLASGSRLLGEAINEAGAYSDAGDIAGAQKVLRAFLNKCKMPFYSRIASERLVALGGGNGT